MPPLIRRINGGIAGMVSGVCLHPGTLTGHEYDSQEDTDHERRDADPWFGQLVVKGTVDGVLARTAQGQCNGGEPEESGQFEAALARKETVGRMRRSGDDDRRRIDAYGQRVLCG